MRNGKQVVGIVVLLFVVSSFVWGAPTKTYQVTGKVLDVNDSMIVVEKGKEKWEIARDPSTKITGDLKKDAKVTIEYRMTATSVEVKEEKKVEKKKEKK